MQSSILVIVSNLSLLFTCLLSLFGDVQKKLHMSISGFLLGCGGGGFYLLFDKSYRVCFLLHFFLNYFFCLETVLETLS